MAMATAAITMSSRPQAPASPSQSQHSLTNPNLQHSCNHQHHHEELQYLNLIREIIARGLPRYDRTGTGTLSVFAPNQLRYSLADNRIPLLTTKSVFFRGVVEELLWFLRGDTDARILQEKGVHIWDRNASREYLDYIGLKHRQEGDLGPIYGFQWRHFGADYDGCNQDYSGKGVDQLMQVIDKIKNNPYDRRIIMSAWNPKDLPLMALPPCHMLCQFYVSVSSSPDVKPTLSCLLYQRSADVGLGVPFNIASYAILTRIIAHLTDTVPGEFIHTLGDAHIYLDHLESLKIQLEREPRESPTLKIKEGAGFGENGEIKIENLRYEDFVLEGYKPYSKIDMTMSV